MATRSNRSSTWIFIVVLAVLAVAAYFIFFANAAGGGHQHAHLGALLSHPELEN